MNFLNDFCIIKLSYWLNEEGKRESFLLSLLKLLQGIMDKQKGEGISNVYLLCRHHLRYKGPSIYLKTKHNFLICRMSAKSEI